MQVRAAGYLQLLDLLQSDDDLNVKNVIGIPRSSLLRSCGAVGGLERTAARHDGEGEAPQVGSLSLIGRILSVERSDPKAPKRPNLPHCRSAQITTGVAASRSEAESCGRAIGIADTRVIAVLLVVGRSETSSIRPVGK